MPPAPPKTSSQATLRRGAPERSPFTGWLIAAGLGVFAIWFFWQPLILGGGLIGGDLYPYFFPQKQFLSDSLRSGTIPLWNPLVGFGYPVLGESQTAALYPPNLLLYSLLPVNTAYNVSQLLHYFVTFLASFAFAQRLRMGVAGSVLTALTFTFGWFPARICLEWAIIGGCWFSVCLWCAAGWLQTGNRRFACGLALALGMDLLAGHYNLAFITLLTLVPLPWLLPVEMACPSLPASARLRRVCLLAAAVCVGFLIGAIQLLPTWELKSLSQRETENVVFAPTYGHLPPLAISQLWMPWAWYAGKKSTDTLLQQSHWGAVSPATNQVEAQLYLGLLPLMFALGALAVTRLRWRRDLVIAGQEAYSPLSRFPAGRWGLLILVSLLFATGWPTYFLYRLPGIGFFRGPGRYSITAAWGIAVLSGLTLDHIVRWKNLRPALATALALLVWALTLTDLWLASRKYDVALPGAGGRQVFYATLVDRPPISQIPMSVLRQDLAPQREFIRLYAPGQNVPTLMNVSAIPTYLGLGPEFYESPEMRVDFQLQSPEQVADALRRLRRFGVTHLLLEQQLDAQVWPVRLVQPVVDPVLNGAFGRREPFYLYELQQPGQRFEFLDHPQQNRVTAVRSTPNRVQIDVDVRQPDTLVFRDLWYPGWELENAGLHSQPYDTLFRSVEVQPGATEQQTIIWVYRPKGVMWGAVLSVVGLMCAIWLGVAGKSKA